MSLTSFTLLSGATCTPTGGTAVSFAGSGIVNGSITAVATGDSSLLTRRECTFSAKKPKVSAGAPNGYTQARVNMAFHSPLALDNGNTTTNTGRAEFSFDVETSDAERDELRIMLAQMILGSDFDNLIDELILA